jgi:hypothetical protein
MDLYLLLTCFLLFLFGEFAEFRQSPLVIGRHHFHEA